MGMLAPTLRRNIGNSAFQNLEQCLLHPFTGDVAGYGGILIFAADLIDLVDVDDSSLGAAHVAIGCLQEFEDNIFHVLTHVTGFGERGGIDDGERNVEHLGQGLRQQSFAGAGGADKKNVALGELHIAVALAIHVNALVVVVNRHRQFFLGLLLADDILIEKNFYLL